VFQQGNGGITGIWDSDGWGVHVLFLLLLNKFCILVA
jgi:hypothetical protein